MADTLSLQESILVYLDISGGLQRLVEDCKSFRGTSHLLNQSKLKKLPSLKSAMMDKSTPFEDPQQVEAVYRFYVSVNPSDVMDLDPVLGDWILHDPLRATGLFQYVSDSSELEVWTHTWWINYVLHLQVCFVAIKTLSLVEKIHTQSQV